MGHSSMSRRAPVCLLPAIIALVFALPTDCAKVARAFAATAATTADAANPTTFEQRAMDGVAAITGAPCNPDSWATSWSRSTGEDDDPDLFCLANRISVDIEGTS